MPIYIALLKGINVGGHKKIPMAELRDLLTKSGFQNVQTYIQSGNLVFASLEKSEILENKINAAIKSHFDFDVSVIVKTRNELQFIFDACPFSSEKKENSYFVIFNKIPETENMKEVSSNSYENENIIILNDALYFYSSVGYGNAKFNMANYERKLKVIGTARNYNTMVKLLSLSAD